MLSDESKKSVNTNTTDEIKLILRLEDMHQMYYFLYNVAENRNVALHSVGIELKRFNAGNIRRI
jgi:hypothetical protein